jgi:hypothetical protein
MRIKVAGKVYTPIARDEVSLRDLMLFNHQARDFGITWAEVTEMMEEWDDLSEEEAASHPNLYMVIGVTIWMSRRAAGEDLTFSEAVDVNLGDVDFIPDPEDRKPGKAKGAKKPRKASVPAESPAVAADLPTTSAPQESGSPSTPE